jgi:hypothetical protein
MLRIAVTCTAVPRCVRVARKGIKMKWVVRPALLATLALAQILIPAIGPPAGPDPIAAQIKVDGPIGPGSVYSSGNIAIALTDLATTDSLLSVPLGGAVIEISVRLRINHPRLADLDIQLISPDGTAVKLANNVGGSNADFGAGTASCAGVLTAFDDDATTSVFGGAGPGIQRKFTAELQRADSDPNHGLTAPKASCGDPAKCCSSNDLPRPRIREPNSEPTASRAIAFVDLLRELPGDAHDRGRNPVVPSAFMRHVGDPEDREPGGNAVPTGTNLTRDAGSRHSPLRDYSFLNPQIARIVGHCQRTLSQRALGARSNRPMRLTS